MSTPQRKGKSRPSWHTLASFPESFSYEVDAPLKEVVQNLAELEQEQRLFRRTSAQEISVLPAGDQFVFRVRRRRHGTITAMIEGHVWQDETGCTLVEGETRMNGWSMITPLVVVGVLGFGFLLPFLRTPIPFVIPLVLFVLTMIAGSALSWRAFTRDRKQLAAQLHEVVTSTQETNSKRKRSSRLALEEEGTAADASMWSEDPAPRQEKRR